MPDHLQSLFVMKYHLLHIGKLLHSIAHSQVNGQPLRMLLQLCCICIVFTDQILYLYNKEVLSSKPA